LRIGLRFLNLALLIGREGKQAMAETPKRRPTTKRAGRVKEGRPVHGPAAPSDEEVRRRAYELYRERGEEPGHELDDWTRAERELRGDE